MLKLLIFITQTALVHALLSPYNVQSGLMRGVHSNKLSSYRYTYPQRSMHHTCSTTARKAHTGDETETMQPSKLVSLGMKRFTENKIEDSIELFDRADSAVPNGSLTPYLWQRGISLYYTDRFKEGSNQVCLHPPPSDINIFVLFISSTNAGLNLYVFSYFE
jgi:hypothetical protein